MMQSGRSSGGAAHTEESGVNGAAPSTRWWGGLLVPGDVQAELQRLLVAATGDADGPRLVREVVAQPFEVESRISLLPFVIGVPDDSDPDRPLRALEDATTIEVDRAGSATLTTVSSVFGSELTHLTSEDLDLVLSGSAGLQLAVLDWGAPTSWRPVEVDGAEIPPVPVASGVLLATSAPTQVVPRSAPVGRPSLPSLLESVATGLAWTPGVPWMRHPGAKVGPLAEKGAMTALLVGTASPLGDGLDDVLLLWEGRDVEGCTVAIAVQRTRTLTPRLELPLWAGQMRATEADPWMGDILLETPADDEGALPYRYRLAAYRAARLYFPSRRLAASDPCVAGSTAPLLLDLTSDSPFEVLRVDLRTVDADGGDFDEDSRGLLLVIDPDEPPVRWAPAIDETGARLVGGIETGRLAIGDAAAGVRVEEERELGIFGAGSMRTLELKRSTALGPADMAIVGSLGGDGPSWTLTGHAEDGHIVAVLIANFDLYG